MAKKEPRIIYKDLMKSSGKPGEMLVNKFRQEEERVDTLKIDDYRKMIDNDGQIQMLYNAIVNLIISVGFDIEDDPSYKAEEDSEEKKFLESCVFDPKYKGGMSINIETTCKTMLRAFIEGYRVFEIVYKLRDDGKIGLEKLSPRAAENDFGMKLKVDENGSFMGYHQRITFNNEWVDVEVVNSGDVLKAVKATYGEEFGSLYGRSGLKAVWYHYDKAHKGMFLNHVGHEFGTNKFMFVRTKGNANASKVDHIISELSKIYNKTVYVAPENEQNIVFETLSDPQVMAVGKDMINLHYSLIAKSILAQFADLGSTISDTGSRALGDSQIDFFKIGLQQIATVLIENTWNEVLACLIKLNFNNNIYPTFKVRKIGDDTTKFIYDALLELVKSGSISDAVKKELTKEGAQKLGLDVSEDMLDEEDALKDPVVPAPPVQDTVIDPNVDPNYKEEDVKLEDVVGSDGVVRPLYLEEQNIKFRDIGQKFDIEEMNARNILQDRLNKQKEGIIDAYLEASRSGRSSIKKVQVNLEESSKYSEELLLIALSLFEYGKTQAANELLKSIPTTTKAERQSLVDKVDLIISEQSARLGFRLQNLANDSLKRNIPENEARNQMETEYTSFFDTVLTPTIAALVPESFNLGTRYTYSRYESEIFGYRYSAVLDSHTTNFCRRMDGRLFQVNDPQAQTVWPPNHFGCRSRMVAVTKELQSEQKYKVDGLPANVEVTGSLSSFRDIPS